MGKWIIMILFPVAVYGQPAFEWDQNIPVRIDDDSLSLAWAGGVNAPQVGKVDLDLDGVEDLVLFDRTSRKFSTFLHRDSKWVYQPAYEDLLPADLEGWVLFRDYNCDGKKDIFTHTLFGIKIYENTSSQSLSWNLVVDPVFTEGFNGPINLQVNIIDLPAIGDMDGDGDLDILVFDFGAGGNVEYHQNFSVEITGSCGVDFVRVSNNWGDFEECFCEEFAFGEPCNAAGRIQHMAGKSILAYDMDNDGDQELLVGQEDCYALSLLPNDGTPDIAKMTSFSSFPFDHPVNVNYPAAFLEDVDFDGQKDLLTASNFFFNRNNEIDFENSLSLYKNTGTNLVPDFTFQSNDFLVGEMIDVGENAVPALADYDRDGDLDLFIGTRGSTEEAFAGSLWFFENIGGGASPEYRLITKDYLSIRSLQLIEIKPFFTDLNMDGRPDLVFSGSISNQATLYALLNNSNAVFSFDLDERIALSPDLDQDDHFCMTDVNSDGRPDLLVGRLSGQLDYFRNSGGDLATTFSLETEAFYGIESNFERKFLTISVADIDGDQQPDLVTGDQRGAIQYYPDYLASIENPEAPQPIVIKDSFGAHSFGNGFYLAAGRIYNGYAPALVVGQINGGVQILKNLDMSEGGEPEPDLELIVYPNPLLDTQTLTVSTNQSGSVQLMNLLGQPLSGSQPILPGIPLRMDTSTIPQGMYLLTMRTGGSSVAKRVVIY